MKLLHDKKGVKGLQKLINRFSNKETSPEGNYAIRKTRKHKRRTKCKMRLTVQIGEYKMD